MKYLPTDIAAAASLSKTHDPFSLPWPVSESAFQGYAQATYQAYGDAIACLEGIERDLLIADVRMVDQVVQTAHALAVTKCAHENHIQLQTAGPSANYYAPNWEQLATFHQRAVAAQSRVPSFLKHLRRASKQRQVGALLSHPGLLLFGRHVWSLGTPTSLCEAWVRNEAVTLTWPSFEKLHRAGNECTVPPDVGRAIEGFLATAAERAAEVWGITLPIGELMQVWLARLGTLAKIYAGVTATRPPAGVLINAGAHAIYRTIALASRRRGLPVVASLHGHNPGYVDAVNLCYNDLAVCNILLAESVAAARASMRRAEMVVVPPDRAVSFEVLPLPQLRDQWGRRAKRKTGGPIKTVMLIGYPPSPQRMITDVSFLFYFRAKLERQLLSDLLGLGYEVTYKSHPEWRESSVQLFASSSHHFDSSPLMDVLHTADVVVFTSPMTTALAQVLLSETPIVMMDLAGQRWAPEIRRLLEGRVSFCPAEVQLDGSIVYESASLQDALVRASSLNAPDYVLQFLLDELRTEAV